MAQSLLPPFANYTPDASQSPGSLPAGEPAWHIAFGIVGVFGVVIAILNINCENSFLAKLWASVRPKRSSEPDVEKDADDRTRNYEELRRVTEPGSLLSSTRDLSVCSAQTTSPLIDRPIDSQAVTSTPALVDGIDIGTGTVVNTSYVPCISPGVPSRTVQDNNWVEMMDIATDSLSMHACELGHVLTNKCCPTCRPVLGLPQPSISPRLEPSDSNEDEFGGPYEISITSHGSNMSSYISPITSDIELEAFMMLDTPHTRAGLWRLFDIIEL